ncbi:hypothetical protein [Actinomyces vulturis]|uniref:hypothetical protein n=1 Tax=Actinomyces vulturis TaxID=1857645 RepID=UPI00159EDCA5|nr:hypothetical protein [Actinomyces vulturis]
MAANSFKAPPGKDDVITDCTEQLKSTEEFKEIPDLDFSGLNGSETESVKKLSAHGVNV